MKLTKQGALDLMKRRTAVVAVVVAALVLAMGALAFRSSSASAGAPAGKSEQPATQADAYRALNDPKRSGLEPKLASQLAGLGAQVVKADVTGVGRDAYPDYWAGGQYRPCCQSISVQAAGARRSATHPGMIEVIVAWSAQRLDNGPALTNQVETVTFEQLGTDWRPVHPELLSR
jgi:hypothetical protein